MSRANTCARNRRRLSRIGVRENTECARESFVLGRSSRRSRSSPSHRHVHAVRRRFHSDEPTARRWGPRGRNGSVTSAGGSPERLTLSAENAHLLGCNRLSRFRAVSAKRASPFSHGPIPTETDVLGRVGFRPQGDVRLELHALVGPVRHTYDTSGGLATSRRNRCRRLSRNERRD